MEYGVISLQIHSRVPRGDWHSFQKNEPIAKFERRSSPIVERKSENIRVSIEKLCSAVAVETGVQANIVMSLIMLGKYKEKVSNSSINWPSVYFSQISSICFSLRFVKVGYFTPILMSPKGYLMHHAKFDTFEHTFNLIKI